MANRFLKMWVAGWLASVALVSFAVAAESQSAGTLEVRLYQSQERYYGGYALLELALKKLERPYRIVLPKVQDINEARGERLVVEGEFDLEFMSTTPAREEQMIPIRIPVYQGMLGLRLLLATPEKQALLTDLQSLDDLRGYLGAHGADWGDLPVYAANRLPVLTNPSYEGLFRQLIAGRTDYFHRGINEIWGELDRYQGDLVIVDGIMLFYPHPVYFFVSPTQPELAQLLERGLEMAMEDGSARELFGLLYGDVLEKANLASRRLIVLQNPVIPPNTPMIDTSWWLPPEISARIEEAEKARLNP